MGARLWEYPLSALCRHREAGAPGPLLTLSGQSGPALRSCCLPQDRDDHRPHHLRQRREESSQYHVSVDLDLDVFSYWLERLQFIAPRNASARPFLPQSRKLLCQPIFFDISVNSVIYFKTLSRLLDDVAAPGGRSCWPLVVTRGGTPFLNRDRQHATRAGLLDPGF